MEGLNLGCCKLSWGSVSKNLTTTQRRMVKRRCELGGGDHEDYRWGRLVDENMIVLRWRIKEMKMLEANQEAPSHWMKWEKQYYAHYDQHVFQAMEFLQSYLMDLRPSVALGMLVLVALSVLMCFGMGLSQAAKTLLSCFGLKQNQS